MYDVVILGGGPAGLAAAMYAGRYELSVCIVSEDIGGQMNLADKVENYPGILSISGVDLMLKFKEHAEKFGAKITYARAEKIEKTDAGFAVVTPRERIEGKTLIYTLGSKHRHLGAPGEDKLIGKGVSYCATCDGAFFKNKTVAIVGAGNSAFTGAVIVAQYAKKLYIIHRRDEFRADPVTVAQVQKLPNVEFVLNTNVVEIQGETFISGAKLDKPLNGSDVLPLEGIFIEIGSDPLVKLAQEVGVEVSHDHLIVVRPDQRTNIEGLYAAGDVTTGSNNFRQAITSASEGTIAADAIFNYLKAKEA
jgi:thioredoxin reductase (NADPH)